MLLSWSAEDVVRAQAATEIDAATTSWNEGLRPYIHPQIDVHQSLAEDPNAPPPLVVLEQPVRCTQFEHYAILLREVKTAMQSGRERGAVPAYTAHDSVGGDARPSDDAHGDMSGEDDGPWLEENREGDDEEELVLEDNVELRPSPCAQAAQLSLFASTDNVMQDKQLNTSNPSDSASDEGPVLEDNLEVIPDPLHLETCGTRLTGGGHPDLSNRVIASSYRSIGPALLRRVLACSSPSACWVCFSDDDDILHLSLIHI